MKKSTNGSLRIGAILLLFAAIANGVKAQSADQKKAETDRIRMEHEQIGITDDTKSGYKHTSNVGTQWYPHAGFGMFIHWSIASIKEVDLSWPMMAGTQMKGKNSAEVANYLKDGDYFAGNRCEIDNSCLTPNQYWEQAKYFNPQSYDPDKWVKAAKEAGMKYAVLTTRHHDGFALWPSRFGNFNTKNYMGGRDLVKDFVTACRKYGVKVGLYYSGPDWYFNKDFQSFMYHGIGENYPNVPELDADLHQRTIKRSEAEKQAHYQEVAKYIKGQVEELLTNYGQVDMIWFDGSPDIPKGNPAWQNCITMEQIHKLQPGIVVSPRFFGYGDYKTFEGDKNIPAAKQDGWAELCITSTNSGWGYNSKSPIKTSNYLLSKLIACRALNTNLLLNFGPDKDGSFSSEENQCLGEIAAWMKLNGRSLESVEGINSSENCSVTATAKGNYRYLFLIPPENKNSIVKDETITYKTSAAPHSVSLISGNKKLKYTVDNGTITIRVPANLRSKLVEVVSLEL